MTTLTELNTIQDIVKSEADALLCRETCEVYAGTTVAVGDICEPYSSSNDAKKQVLGVAAVSDVQTHTFEADADGGAFGIRYKGQASASLAYNVSTADYQVAVRALHADLVASTVAGTAGEAYVITTAGVACDDINMAFDLITDGGTAEPSSITHTTQGAVATVGENADSICLAPAACVNEVQSIVMGGTPSGGTFTLTLTNKLGAKVTTTGLAYNASAATISTAIDVALDEALQCVVTGTTLPDHTLTATWSGESYSGRPQEMIVTDLLLQTGGAGTYGTSAVTETTEGKQGESVFLTRGPAVVDHAYLDYNSCTEATVNTALAGLEILVRTGPTYTTL